MNKIFVVAGELSGDKLGGWYVQRLLQQNPGAYVEAVGGNFLEASGATLYERFEKLNVVGIIEILSRLSFLQKFLKNLIAHILKNNFDQVVVVDFPGFNLRLIKKLKQANPSLSIVYLSPPQLWAWGEWRVKTIKSCCDQVVVLYPFEVEWYKQRGVQAEWQGYPFFSKFEPYFDRSSQKNKKIAILPGSRESEIHTLLPLMISVVKGLKLADSYLQVVLPLADSLNRAQVEKLLRSCGVARWRSDITIVQGEQEILSALSTCCFAITKPGTVTLELALLGVPAVVMYKTSWFTYMVARPLINIKQMALPNLLLNKVVYPEFIQSDCSVENVWGAALDLYKKFLADSQEYGQIREQLYELRELLGSKDIVGGK